MKTDEIREKYLEYFESKGHTRRSSDVLVPPDDESVLFTPAGMNQFKDHFLGKVKLEFTRATTCQKCLRTGDIDNVGRTPRHHTFFEMLGNFSFGDYFKREAIQWAWEFLTDKDWLAIDPDRLSVTVYQDDDEAAEIWNKEIGLPESKIRRLGEEDNFWPASAPSEGPDGVCGPCSEIFYHFDDGSELEIWNLVFTQFNRVGDPPDNLTPLPSKNIDTGMGLERTAAVMQGVDTNFHIDIIKPIVLAAAELCGVKYDPKSDDGRRLRRITDHVRACTFAIHENVEPGHNRENYVVRRLLRRAILDGHQMNMREPFLSKLVPVVVEMMKVPYPELSETAQRVQHEIEREEIAFLRTIDDAVARINETFDELKSKSKSQPQVPGDTAGMMYTTYGVPPELFEQLARDHSIGFDWDGFRSYMVRHGEISGGQRGPLFPTGAVEALKNREKETKFVGYDTTDTTVTVKGIISGSDLVTELEAKGAPQDAVLVLDQTPFYAESGGQVGDIGEIKNKSFTFQVTDTQKDSALILHWGKLVSGKVSEGDSANATVDESNRDALRRAHSATHMLHHALHQNVGEHAQQRGSKVEPDQLRFDFKNDEQIPVETLTQIECDVAKFIDQDDPVSSQELSIEEARAQGAMMLFGEKYPERVRMISIGDYSKELCGGTHLTHSGEVKRFEIISEEAVSAGTRRITALTGSRALEHETSTREAVESLSKLLGVSASDLPDEVERLMDIQRRLKKQIQTGQVQADEPSTTRAIMPGKDLTYTEIRDVLRQIAKLLNTGTAQVTDRIRSMLDEQKQLRAQVKELANIKPVTADSLLEEAKTIGETAVICVELKSGNPNQMRQLIDQIRKKTKSSAVFLGAALGDSKVILVSGVSRDLVDKGVSAGNWVKEIAPLVGGGGGGRADMAQAGGSQPDKLAAAIESAQASIEKQLG